MEEKGYGCKETVRGVMFGQQENVPSLCMMDFGENRRSRNISIWRYAESRRYVQDVGNCIYRNPGEDAHLLGLIARGVVETKSKIGARHGPAKCYSARTFKLIPVR